MNKKKEHVPLLCRVVCGYCIILFCSSTLLENIATYFIPLQQRKKSSSFCRSSVASPAQQNKEGGNKELFLN